MYLNADQQRALWRRVAQVLAPRPGSLLLFDLTPTGEQPKVGWVGRILGRLMRAFTRGRGFERDQRTRTALIEELKASGFREVTVHDAQTEVPAVPMVVFACGGAMLLYPGIIGS